MALVPITGRGRDRNSARKRGKSISRRQLMVGGATLAAGGNAIMQTYLNSLHEFAPQGTILIVRGTYFDKARHSPENGWQIYDMNLVYVSIETRAHTPPAPPEEEASEEGGAEGDGEG